jgi:hypothetical protein
MRALPENTVIGKDIPMKSILVFLGLALSLGPLANVAGARQSEPEGAGALGYLAADTTLPAVFPAAIPEPLKVLQPGVLVRATHALCGDTRIPPTVTMGKFVELEREAFEVEVTEGDRRQLHQVAIDDLIRLEVGTERPLTTRGTVIGTVTGVALGVVGAAIGGSNGDAEYGSGAAIGGLVGAGFGALFGSRNTATDWEELPLYGQAYCE